MTEREIDVARDYERTNILRAELEASERRRQGIPPPDYIPWSSILVERHRSRWRGKKLKAVR